MLAIPIRCYRTALACLFGRSRINHVAIAWGDTVFEPYFDKLHILDRVKYERVMPYITGWFNLPSGGVLPRNAIKAFTDKPYRERDVWKYLLTLGRYRAHDCMGLAHALLDIACVDVGKRVITPGGLFRALKAKGYQYETAEREWRHCDPGDGE